MRQIKIKAMRPGAEVVVIPAPYSEGALNSIRKHFGPDFDVQYVAGSVGPGSYRMECVATAKDLSEQFTIHVWEVR